MSIRPLPGVLCAALLVACAPRTEPELEAPEPEPLTADHLANLIAADGARHTILVLSGPADPTGMDKVFAGIATGAPDWLALVPAIEPEVDGLYAEALQDALGKALPHNPAGVLALLPRHGGYQLVCADADQAMARPPVAAVTDPALRSARVRCLQYMDADAAELETLEGR